GCMEGSPEAGRRIETRPPPVRGDDHEDEDGHEIGQHGEIIGRHSDTRSLKIELENGDATEEPGTEHDPSRPPGREDDDGKGDPTCACGHSFGPLRDAGKREIGAADPGAGTAKRNGGEAYANDAVAEGMGSVVVLAHRAQDEPGPGTAEEEPDREREEEAEVDDRI